MVPSLTLASLWFRAASERGYNRVRDGIANVLADLSESLHGVRTVAANNRQRYNIVHHRNVVGDYRDGQQLHGPDQRDLRARARRCSATWARRRCWRSAATWSIAPPASIGALVAFFLYLNRFFAPIQLLVAAVQHLPAGSVLDRQAAHAVRARAEHARGRRRDGAAPDRGRDHLRPRDLRLRPGRRRSSATSTCAIRAGETVAFVGQTGAGKSTLAKLITRFYDPTEGRVLIDGHDLRDGDDRLAAPPARRRAAGAVPVRRQPALQHRLRVARRQPTRRSGRRSTRSASATSSSGCPTASTRSCTSAASRCRRGERQLIALARAFLAHPRVLVLDEATSNLDLLSETKIEAALDVLLQARTAVLIAHRLTTAMKADRIVVVDDGRIVETRLARRARRARRSLRRDVRDLDQPHRARGGVGASA